MDTRESLRRMRNFKKGVVEDFSKKPIKEDEKKDLSVRDMFAITRNFKAVNEADEVKSLDINQDGEPEAKVIDVDADSHKTAFDQQEQEQKFKNAIQQFNVNVEFEPMKITDNTITWGGTIDNQLQWSFLVTPDESINGPKFNYSENFNDQEPSNTELVEFIENYYNDFYKYWREGELEQ